MGKALEKIKEMKIPLGALIEIYVGSDEVRPVYFAGVDSFTVSYYEKVINNINDIRSKPYFNNVPLEEIDSIVLHNDWGKVKKVK